MPRMSKRDRELAEKAAQSAKEAAAAEARVIEPEPEEPEVEPEVEPEPEEPEEAEEPEESDPEPDPEPEPEPVPPEMEAGPQPIAGGFAKLRRMQQEQRAAIAKSRRRQGAARKGQSKGLTHIQRAALKNATAPQVQAAAEKLIKDMGVKVDRLERVSKMSLAKAHNAGTRRAQRQIKQKLRRARTVLQVAAIANPQVPEPEPQAPEGEGQE